MKKVLTIILALLPFLAFAQDIEEDDNASYGFASDSYNERTDSVMPIRYISAAQSSS